MRRQSMCRTIQYQIATSCTSHTGAKCSFGLQTPTRSTQQHLEFADTLVESAGTASRPSSKRRDGSSRGVASISGARCSARQMRCSTTSSSAPSRGSTLRGVSALGWRRSSDGGQAHHSSAPHVRDAHDLAYVNDLTSMGSSLPSSVDAGRGDELGRALDFLRQEKELFLGEFDVLSFLDRRQGGQGVVQFMTRRSDRLEYAVKFFNDREGACAVFECCRPLDVG